MAQMAHYGLSADLYAEMSVPADFVDAEGKFKKRKDGEIIFNFSKHFGRLVKEIAVQDAGFLRWMLGADFAPDTKDVVCMALEAVRS